VNKSSAWQSLNPSACWPIDHSTSRRANGGGLAPGNRGHLQIADIGLVQAIDNPCRFVRGHISTEFAGSGQVNIQNPLPINVRIKSKK
jgi:hypothetical protein